MVDNDYVILTPKDARWPKCLDNLRQPPEVIFCRGNLQLLSSPTVGIIGTRRCTRYGIDVAKKFARGLSEAGIVVVSGLADGIDTAAHIGAMPKTIAVLGNGINQFYPAVNMELQNKIAREGGLILSEYPPDMKSSKFTFPQRNRIVAALSRALVIVEADLKSGTMITKEYALDLGIDVYAVPGPVTSFASRGTNELIKTAACACITDVSDILDSFGVTVSSDTENEIMQISFEAMSVLEAMKLGETHFDEILESTKFSVKKLSTLLTKMELDGLIEKLPGNFYISKLRG